MLTFKFRNQNKNIQKRKMKIKISVKKIKIKINEKEPKNNKVNVVKYLEKTLYMVKLNHRQMVIKV